MALSGSTNFTINAGEAITEALENIGVKDHGNAAEASAIETSLRTFNLMLKSIKGLTLWKWAEACIPLSSDTANYILGPNGDATDVETSEIIDNPNEIDDIRLRSEDGTERPCNIISITEYNQYVNKDTTGATVNVALKPGLTTSVLCVWPLNSLATDELRFQYKKPLDDLDTINDSIDCPEDWLEAITFQLTARLASKFQLPLNDRVYWKKLADEAWDNLDDYEKNTSFFVEPRRW